jgi:NarL family two-component system response regulator LiaR
MIRLLLVDDQDIVRQGLQIILSHQPDIEVVGAAADGEDALTLVARLKPDVVLMDLKMPRLNGIHATRRITQAHPEIKVIALTTYDDDEWVFDAIRAGAAGYLLKDSDRADILAAVRGVQAGEVRVDPKVAGKVLAEFNRLQGGALSRQQVAPSPGLEEPLLEELSEREMDVLRLLAQGRTNQEIADELCLSVGTVKNYVSSVIGKLQANDRTQAAIYALKRGLVTL